MIVAGLVNAALRRFQRERDALLVQVSQSDEGRYAHPQWLVREFRKAWPSHWEAICNTNQLEPPMWLRVNRCQTDVADYLAALVAAGLQGSEVQAFPDAVRLAAPAGVDQLSINELVAWKL